MSGGFRVDLSALVSASEGVNGVTTGLRDNKVSGLGNGASYGDEALAAAMAGFCDRWETGVQNLVTDASQVARRLALSAAAYARAEHVNVALAQGVMQRRSGPDPAASRW
jgi:hypothetical protein